MKKTRIEMLIIDPQNDFMDIRAQLGEQVAFTAPDGTAFRSALPVTGAQADSERLAELITRLDRKIADIHVTLDTHQQLDVAHPMMWVSSRGESPAPFTVITSQEVRDGKWRAFNPAYQPRLESYLEKLEANGRYPLTIWNPHCLVGTWGHNVVAPIMDSLMAWERTRMRRVDYVTKGHNPWTEHYSGVMADVPDPEDATTQLNIGLIETLKKADIVLFSGQALDFCVANTVRDIARNFGEQNVRKTVLIEDTTSPVLGYGGEAAKFLQEMRDQGMQTTKAADFTI